MSEMEMLGSPWFDVEEGIQKRGDGDTGVDLSFKTYLPTPGGSSRHSFHQYSEKGTCSSLKARPYMRSFSLKT